MIDYRSDIRELGIAAAIDNQKDVFH